MRPVNEIVVHCTATRPDFMAESSTAAKVEEVRRWHKARNWSDIGYHFLIDRDGTVMEGRPIERKGAHVKGRNTGTISASLFGGHGSSENDLFHENFTPHQDDALRRLISDLQSRYGKLKLSGHNEYAAKACPGFKVRNWFEMKAPRKSFTESTTLIATGTTLTGVTTAAGAAAPVVTQLDPTAQIIVICALIVAFAGLAWITRERWLKWVKGVR